jgi:hypothetical protein
VFVILLLRTLLGWIASRNLHQKSFYLVKQVVTSTIHCHYAFKCRHSIIFPRTINPKFSWDFATNRCCQQQVVQTLLCLLVFQDLHVVCVVQASALQAHQICHVCNAHRVRIVKDCCIHRSSAQGAGSAV